MDNETSVANTGKLLKLLRKLFGGTIEDGQNFDLKRLNLYDELCKFKYWEGPLPDLVRIFNREENEWLLKKSVDSIVLGAPDSLLDFAIKCKYKDVPELDEDGRPILRSDTALLYAARCKRYDVVHELFEIYDRPDVNYTDESGLTHFHLACLLRKNELVKRFLEHGQYPDCQASVEIDPPLLSAIRHGDREIFRLLLKNCADPNRALNKQRQAALHLICLREGDLCPMAKRFLKINEEMKPEVLIDVKDEDGMTPLMAAISMQNWRQAELLLRQGADAKLADESGSTPLHYMGTLEEALHKTTIQSLLDRIPNPKLATYVEKWTIDDKLYQELIKLLLKKGANPNAVDDRGWTVVHVLCQREDDDDSLPSSQTLLSLCEAVGQSLKIDEPDKSGYTPLHYAVVHESVDLVEFLLTRGADPNAVTVCGLNCLHLICRRDADDPFLEAFLKICDDRGLRVQLDAADELGETLLQWAVEKILPNVVGVLVARGANVSRVVFPTMDLFDERFGMIECRADLRRLACGVVKVLICLERNRYEFSPENVKSIRRTFAKYGVRLALTENGKMQISVSRRRKPENSQL